MAERRMFSKNVIDSDLFLDMPSTAQNLYFHLCMRADDDGFVNSPQKIMRLVSCSKNDMDILIAKRYLIPFETGVCVITHWRIHNYLRSDRYKETMYLFEKSMITETSENNKIYQLKGTNKVVGIPNVHQVETNSTPSVDAGKYSIGYDSIDNNREENNTPSETSKNKEETSTFNEVEQIERLDEYKDKTNKDKSYHVEELFNQFWKSYPKKADKVTAFSKFKKIKNLDLEFPIIMKSLDIFKRSKDWTKDDGQYIQLPSTWLNKQRWKDEGVDNGYKPIELPAEKQKEWDDFGKD